MVVTTDKKQANSRENEEGDTVASFWQRERREDGLKAVPV
jgi:hypothetical protein